LGIEAESDLKIQRLHSSVVGEGILTLRSPKETQQNVMKESEGLEIPPAQKEDNGVKPRSTGKRSRKLNGESFRSKFTTSGIMSDGSVEAQTHQT